MRRLVCFAVAGLLLAPSIAAAEPTAVNLALARRYAEALHMENIMGSLMSNLMPVMVERTSARRGVKVTTELKDAVTRAAETSVRRMTPRMLEVMTPAIAESFTEEELKAAVAYYESPLAQSLLAKTPAYTARATPALATLMPAMEADLEAEICREIGCDTGK